MKKRSTKVYLGLLGVVVAAVVGAVVIFNALGGDAIETTPMTSAPDFTLPATNGRMVSFNQFYGKKNALLYFSMGNG